MKIKFYVFHVYKGISYEIHCLFSWLYFSHDSYTLTLFVFTHYIILWVFCWALYI